ncbi:MAG: NADH-quinone oxidoreductase subunit [Actinomycetota bacterium]|jgi:NADH-quinone oxidoreductase subunit N|nr:NADH-quinone oxidoreductase subunit [Actinomycetota bacterium]
MHLAQTLSFHLTNSPVDWHAISPELVLAGAAFFVLLADLFLPEDAKWLAMPLSAAGLFGTLAAVVSLIGGGDRATFSGAYQVNGFALLFKGLFCVIGLIVLAISFHYFRSGRYPQGEYYFLMLCSLLGGVVMASARDLITIFIAIELISVPAFIMAGLRKGDARSNEAALKFFLFGVLSTALMLYGMSLIYGVTGQTQLDAIRHALVTVGDKPIVALSVFFVVVGFAFKISAVPFHFWAPDTYEGAPSPVAAFLSTASKIGGFVGLLILMFVAFPGVSDTWRPAFAVLAVLTMTVGNLIALRQRNIIRLLAYSGIAQSGYVLVAFALVKPGAATNAQAFKSALIYLAIYGIMDLGAFAAAVGFARRGGSYFIDDYAGLWQRSPALATMLAAFLVSLAGAPPMAGLWAKLFIFLAAIDAHVYWLAVVMGVNSVIAAWYYLAVVKRMFFDAPESTDAVEVPYLLRAAMGLAVLALFAVFVYPPIVTALASHSVL